MMTVMCDNLIGRAGLPVRPFLSPYGHYNTDFSIPSWQSRSQSACGSLPAYCPPFFLDAARYSWLQNRSVISSNWPSVVLWYIRWLVVRSFRQPRCAMYGPSLK